MTQSSTNENIQDILQPFAIDHTRIRGQFVRLGPALHTILSQSAYSPEVSRLIGEALLVAAMLSANLKSEGFLTLQLNGEEGLKFLVADADGQGHLRAYAEMHEETKESLLENARLMITFTQNGQSYQSILAINGDSLSEAIEHYFAQSQQIDVALVLAVLPPEEKAGWRAGGILIERVPVEGGKQDAENALDADEQWNHTQTLMKSVTAEELAAPAITSWDVLRRLFHEDGVWAYPIHNLKAQCRCSRERMAGALQSLPKEDVTELMENGKISMHCRFCNRTQIFNRAALQEMGLL